MMSKPQGYNSLSPYLIVENPDAVLDFCEAVFGGERLRTVRDGDRVVHAECRIDDSVLMMGGMPGGLQAHVHVYVSDPVATTRRALDQGATLVREFEDTDDGTRPGGVQSRDGTTWWLSRHG
jgi:uncharacterized glyoxalase superfamily protein PhnB